ncbi:uncharacterized protein LOC125185284 isoform X2 [Salvia hispanica]|uniref:uncharacterized protein LOC125185284 isoform X2 n=1 Tax=Salvia hispanica TaxID=49212 RepID=UPI002009980D|nr:uncharacterized protein LOC125185284 isoform X2 [Salvia hispanica]
MLPYSRVDEGVENGWSACLNYNEKYKSPESPSRLFLSTFLSSYIVLAQHSEWNEDEAMSVFEERVLDKVKYIDNFKWDNYNLILDNIVSGGDIRTRYGIVVEKLILCFIHVLEKCHCVTYGRMLGRAKTELLPVKWMIKGITSNCGMFAMRHMETYCHDRTLLRIANTVYRD